MRDGDTVTGKSLIPDEESVRRLPCSPARSVSRVVTLQAAAAVPQRDGNHRVQHKHDAEWRHIQHREVDQVEQLGVVLPALRDADCLRHAVRQVRGHSPHPDETRGGVQSTGHPHHHHHHLQPSGQVSV